MVVLVVMDTTDEENNVLKEYPIFGSGYNLTNNSPTQNTNFQTHQINFIVMTSFYKLIMKIKAL